MKIGSTLTDDCTVFCENILVTVTISSPFAINSFCCLCVPLLVWPDRLILVAVNSNLKKCSIFLKVFAVCIRCLEWLVVLLIVAALSLSAFPFRCCSIPDGFH